MCVTGYAGGSAFYVSKKHLTNILQAEHFKTGSCEGFLWHVLQEERERRDELPLLEYFAFLVMNN